jgi:hypothetical protein
LLAALTASGTLLRSLVETAPAGPERALLAVLGNRHRAAAIGRACLRALPAAERSADAIAGALCTEVALDRALPAAIIRRRVNERVRRDFAAGAVVAVDGWFLSLTEARLYALAALA